MTGAPHSWPHETPSSPRIPKPRAKRLSKNGATLRRCTKFLHKFGGRSIDRNNAKGNRGRQCPAYVFAAGSRWIGSTHNTVSGFSTGSMSRLIAIASPSLRTSTHSRIWSGLALIS